MTIAVFGATGRTGRPVVEELLARGWSVRALVRDATKLGRSDPRLIPVQGDATNAASVAAVLEGAQAVLMVAGPVPGGPPDLLGPLAKSLTERTAAGSVKRIVWLTGAGVKLPGDPFDLARTLVRGLMALVAGAVLRDSEAGVTEILRAPSSVTVVRAPMLTDRGSGTLALGTKPSRPAPVERTKLAILLVQQLEDLTWSGQAPFVEVR